MTGDILCEYAHTVHAYKVADEAIESRGLVFFLLLLFLPHIYSVIFIIIAPPNPLISSQLTLWKIVLKLNTVQNKVSKEWTRRNFRGFAEGFGRYYKIRLYPLDYKKTLVCVWKLSQPLLFDAGSQCQKNKME